MQNKKKKNAYTITVKSEIKQKPNDSILFEFLSKGELNCCRRWFI